MKPVVLLLLLLVLSPVRGQTAATPHEVIDRLGVQMRQALAAPKPARTAEEVERDAAGEIAALIHAAPGHASLTATDRRGRTPLMQAASGGYPRVVQALLTDASVRQQINHADASGETAWMLAKFAPALTLPACQPGNLTLERQPLLEPYLQRMTMLLAARRSAVVAIAQALEDAGAQPQPDAARDAWLARCPNTAPELRQALARGELQTTLVNDALDRLMRFSKAEAAGLASIPERPPQQMRFIAADARPRRLADLKCARTPPPVLRGSLNWSGSIRLKAVAATRAGSVEALDLTLLPGSDADPVVVSHFQGALIRTLAGYACEGDHVFEQEFLFKVE